MERSFANAVRELTERNAILVLFESKGATKDVQHNPEFGDTHPLHLPVKELVWDWCVSQLVVTIECIFITH